MMNSVDRPTERDPFPRDKVTVSLKEAASLLGVSYGLIYRAVKSREIPSFRVGSKYLIPVQGLRQMVTESVSA